jgi:hypothetical protein
MDLAHEGRDRNGRIYSLSRFALFAAPALIGAALLINASLPTVAQSLAALDILEISAIQENHRDLVLQYKRKR